MIPTFQALKIAIVSLRSPQTALFQIYNFTFPIFFYISIFQRFQTIKQDKPKEDTIYNYRPQGEEFDKAYTYHQKSRTDESEISERRVKSEKITVGAGDIPGTEETKKPRYPTALDIGRIVIDEIPEEKQPLQKRDIPKRDKVKEKRVDMETCGKYDGGQASAAKEDVAKVGRLNIIDHEITTRQSDTFKIHQMVIFLCL